MCSRCSQAYAFDAKHSSLSLTPALTTVQVWNRYACLGDTQKMPQLRSGARTSLFDALDMWEFPTFGLMCFLPELSYALSLLYISRHIFSFGLTLCIVLCCIVLDSTACFAGSHASSRGVVVPWDYE